MILSKGLIGDKPSTNSFDRPIVAVTMATGRQGSSLIKHLAKNGKFSIRAITRNPLASKALELAKLANVKVYKGDLLDKNSLTKCFEGVYAVFGNTTPTLGWKIIRGSMVTSYEMEQGKNLIEAVKESSLNNDLKHFIFSSVCKPKDPLKNNPAPAHFSSKWSIEDYISLNGLDSITTVIRPVSYFENFNSDLPGVQISKNIFPGVVNPNSLWQTIAVDDIGLWSLAVLLNPQRFLGQSINIAGEELTGNQMAALLQKIVGLSDQKVRYAMVPRFIINFIEHDIGMMASWIERTGYGADIPKLKILASELGIEMTSLSNWLENNSGKKIRNNIDKGIISSIFQAIV